MGPDLAPPGTRGPDRLAVYDRPRGPEAAPDWEAFPAAGMHRVYRRLRGLADPLVAAALLLLLSPLMAVIAAVILLDSGRPVLFRQWRAGRHGRPFRIVKFRTMSAAAPGSSLKVSSDDPLITRAGRLLRNSGLDELPNLWNVIRGEMALIGPRPEQYELLDRYEPWQHERHVVKPGITGWWQVHHRDAVPLHLNVERDLFYVRNQGPRVDLAVLLGTLGVLLSALTRGRCRARPVPGGPADAAAARTGQDAGPAGATRTTRS